MVASVATIETTFQDVIRLYDELLNYASENAVATTLVGNEETARGNIQSDYVRANSLEGALVNVRAAINAGLSQGPSLIGTVLLELADVLDVVANKEPWPERGIQAVIDRWYRYFIDETRKVTSNGLAYGVITADGGNIGDGIFNRLAVDDEGQTIESGIPEDVESLCTIDRNSGASVGEEVFQLRGEPRFKDLLKDGGSGIVLPVKALSAADSRSFIGNPSFGDDSAIDPATAAPSSWTLGDGLTAGNTALVTTTYRTYDGEATVLAFRFDDNGSIKQTFDERRLAFTSSQPIYIQLAYNTFGDVAAGVAKNLVLTFGNVSATVNLQGVVTGWNILRIAIGANNWLKAFNKNDAEVKIAITALVAGDSFVIDDVVIGPYTRFGAGEWYAIVGAIIPFLVDDKFTWQNTGGVTGKIQRILVRNFRRYMPTTGAGALLPDP